MCSLYTFTLASLLICGWNFSVTSAQPPQKTLLPTELKNDLSILRFTFEKAHAGLYRYTPKEKLDAAFDRVEARLNRPMTELDFFRILAPLIDLIHDAHTSLKPSAIILKHVSKTAKVFPLGIRYVEGRAFVEKNLSSNKSVPVASEIVSINRMPMTEITEKVLTIKSADGLNFVPKYEVANVNFWINYFEMVDVSEVFEIETRNPPTGKLERFSIEGISAQVLQAHPFKAQTHDTFSLDFIKDGRVALLSIPSFGDLALADRFADAFRRIKEKGVRTLIIDIRDNGCGYDELNTELLSYLVPHPFRFYKGFTFRPTDWDDLKYVKHSPDDFLNTPDLKRFSEVERNKMVRDRKLSVVLDHNCQSNPAAGIHQPKANAFSGNLYLLFNGRSGSSGGEVPALLHFLGVGTLVGEEPNAAYQGTCGGIIPKLTLPHSGIVITFPLLAYQNAVMPGLFIAHGAPPHFVVSETLEDAIRGRDTTLEFVLELIASRSADR